uniref:Uncharacterized protein n=1 Tax=Plectus sambesii TaxID=2011161 RepID=A0A914VNV7_9BILA
MVAKFLVVVFMLAATCTGVGALTCATCSPNDNCVRNYKTTPCFDGAFCYAIAKSLSDKTPMQMGCARNCEEVLEPGVDRLQCSLCGEDNCNKEILDDGRGGSNGFSAATHVTYSLLALFLSFALCFVGIRN